jgi:GAF domain-containing protein
VPTAHTDDLFHRLGEPQRMRCIAGYDLFAPRLAARLNPICDDSAARLNAPVSLISIILDSAQFIVGSHGLQGWVDQVQGVPAEWALCTHTVLAGAPYCVGDALAEPLHRDNPLLAATGLRSYAGVPLLDPGGQAIGAHCVLDVATRTFTDQDLGVLRDGAQRALPILAGVDPAA